MSRLTARLLPCTLLALLALAAPASAANPGQVELISGWLRYEAAAGQANDVLLRVASDRIVLSDAGGELRAAAGCHPGVTAHEVICSPDDSDGGFGFGTYTLATGDGDDRIRVEVDGFDDFDGFTAYGTLNGGTGADVLEGGEGSETLIGGPGADDLRGGGGEYDTASYDDHAGAVTVTLGAADAAQGGAEDGAGDTIAGDVENAIGGDGNDTLTGDDRENQLLGGNGDDVLHGGAEADRLVGGTLWGTGSDEDTLDGGAGADMLAGGRGGDDLAGGAGEDTADYIDRWSLTGDEPEAVAVTIGAGTGDDGGAFDGAPGARDTVRADVENVDGGPGDDTIVGDGGANELDGGAGADVIEGGPGADALTGGNDTADDELDGGTGDDVLRAGTACCIGAQADGADTFRGGDGEDRIDYGYRTASVHVSLDAVADDGEADEGDLVAADVEDITGGNGDDVLEGDADANRLHGGGGTGADVLRGGGGDDRLSGGHGQWVGGQGVGDGLDELDGGPGDDRIDARDRAVDTIACGSDADTVSFDEPDPVFDPGRPEDDLSAGDCEDRNAPRDETAAGTGSATTNDGGDGAEPSDPVETTVTSGVPEAELEIQERSWAIGQVEGDWRTVGQWIQLGADAGGGPAELTTMVTVDASLGDDVALLGADGPLAACDDDTPYWTACLAAGTTTLPDGDRRFTVFSHDATSLHVAVPLAGRVFLDQQGGGRLMYRARPGEENDVEVRFTTAAITLTDAGNAPRASTGCTQVDPATVRCAREETGWSVGGFEVLAGDGADRIAVVTELADDGIAPAGLLDGGDGADELIGGGSHDELMGGAGPDVLRGGAGSDAVLYSDHAGGVVATIGGGADDGDASDGPAGARDDIGSDVETLVGSAQDDVLTGDAQANILAGGLGADTLAGGGGADRLDGAGSYGPVWVPGDDGDDTLDGGAGPDHLDGGIGADDLAGGAGLDTVEYTDRYERPGVVVTLGDAGANDGSADDGPAGARDTVRPDVERLTGSPSADTLTGDGNPNRIDGFGGADTIAGGGGADVLVGGTDTVRDDLQGGDGADTFVAGTAWGDGHETPDGPDRFRGGDGIDRIDYARRAVAVQVSLDGAANDGQAGEGDDVEPDVEWITGGEGDDTLTGSSADNRLHGGPGGSDTLNGGAGDDRLLPGWTGYGTADTDTLRGGAGMDTLSARNGVADLLDCGADLDVAYVDDDDTTKDVVGNCELLNPEGATRTVEPGGTFVLESDVGLAVTSPTGGEVSAASSQILQQAPQGVGFLGLQLNITAPDASLDDPLRITFTLAADLVPAGGAGAVRVFRDGAEVDAACPVPGRATEAGCVAERTTLPDGDVQLVVLTAHASAWNMGAAAPAQPDPPAQPAPTPAPPASAPPAADTTAPALGVTLAAKQKLAALRAGKLTVPVTCSEGCRYTVELRLERKAAKRLGVPTVLARTSGALAAAGRATAKLRPAKQTARKLKRARKLSAVLAVSATDAVGNRAQLTRKLALR